jgi:hypothetical protein
MAISILQTDDGDIYVSPTGTQSWTSPTDLLTEATQRLRAKYQLFLGEWFLDEREGVPYYRDILVKNPNMGVVRTVLRKVTADDPAVEAVTLFEATLDSATRHLTVALTAQLIDGTTLDLEAFIV